MKNPEYKTNLMKLKNFVMVMFGKDTMVDPKESEVLEKHFIAFTGASAHLLGFLNLIL